MSFESDKPTYAVKQTARYFHWSALMEGTSLLLLVFVAVPVKYLLGEPVLVRTMGPIHGITFLAYVWTLMQLQGAAAWPRNRSIMMFCAAFIPFGSYIALSRLRSIRMDVQHFEHRSE